jgi:hypothetical protein
VRKRFSALVGSRECLGRPSLEPWLDSSSHRLFIGRISETL